MAEQQELDAILYTHSDAIKSIHHKIKYQNLNPTPDELLEMEDAVSAKSKLAILDWHQQEIAKARLNEVQSAYEYWINGREFISSYFRERIAELSNSKEAEL